MTIDRITAAHRSRSLTAGALTTVRPLHKTSHVGTIDPTFMDILSMDMYVPIFFAYRVADKSDAAYSELVRGIKESLQKVLVLFFGFAGRWIDSPKGSNGRKLMCNDDGAPFIEAFMDEDLDSVVQASTAFKPVPELQGFALLGMDAGLAKQAMKPDGLPPIFFQVTRFKCGGVVLATTFNHMHTDATGFSNFMTAWSEISRADETSLQADHNRAQVDVPATREVFSGMLDAVPAGDSAASLTSTTMEVKTFQVSASTVKALKQEFKESNKEAGGFVSTVDCILAHFWRSIARLPASLLGDRKPTTATAVEGRTRILDPPLPDLCGNVLALLVAPDIASDELRTMPVVTIASKIRQTLQKIEREEWFDLARTLQALSVFGPDFALLGLSSWFNLPVYEVDFGFGKPFFVSGPNSVTWFRGFAGLLLGPPIPGSPSSVATLYFLSEPTVIQALEQDDQFSGFFA